MTSLLVLLCFVSLAGLEVKASSYDYTASIECIENPQKPQYNGGIITNPELNDGLKGWTASGGAKVEIRESRGNKYIVAYNRNQPYDGVSQKIYLQNHNLYTLSAWIQVREGKVPVTAVFKTKEGFKHGGTIVAESNCWSMLKGGIAVDASGTVRLYFESNNTATEIWIDSISLKPFTHKEWRSHQDQSVEKARKNRVLFKAVDEKGKPLANASISIVQKSSAFPFGCAINKNILNNGAYQNWFTSRFKFTVFEDEMKWYNTENIQGRENYSVADAMLQFARQHHIAVRGQNVIWDDPRYQPGWVPSLSPRQLASAVEKRVNSIVSRYKDQLIAWDAVNENLHFSFFESKLGSTASAKVYKRVHSIDRQTTLFLNDFDTIEDSRDGASTPAKYLQKLRQIKSYPGNGRLPIGIGLESHFVTPPNLPYIRASIDTLAASGSPIWITELDVSSQPNQANYLEEILIELHSHPKIQGIVLWAAWKPQGCYRMCLTNNNFKNLPTGYVVDKLLHQWGFTQLEGTTDSNGLFEASLFHGDYRVKIHHPIMKNSTLAQRLQVTPIHESKQKAILYVGLSKN